MTIDHLSQTSFKIFKKSMAWVGSKHLKSDYSLLQRHLTCSQELRLKIWQWLTIDHLVPTGFKLFEKSCRFEARPQSFHFFLSFLIVTTSASGNNRNSLLAQEESSKSRWGVTKSRIPGVMHCSAWRVGTSLAEKIPSEMEVAPRYNCWNCWHCLWGLGAKCWVEWVSGVDTP